MPFDDLSWRPLPQPQKRNWWEVILEHLKTLAVLVAVLVFGAFVGAAFGSVFPEDTWIGQAPWWVAPLAGDCAAITMVLLLSWWEEYQAYRAHKRGERVLDFRKSSKK